MTFGKLAMQRSLEARNALVQQYRFLPRHVAHTFRAHPGFRRAEREDLEQSGFVALIRAAAYFDERRGTKFVTYAYRAVRAEISRVLRSLPRTRHLCDNCPALAYAPEEPPCDLLSLRRAVAELPTAARELLRLLFESGLTMQAVGRRWGLTREAVRQRRNAILKRLRQQLDGT